MVDVIAPTSWTGNESFLGANPASKNMPKAERNGDCEVSARADRCCSSIGRALEGEGCGFKSCSEARFPVAQLAERPLTRGCRFESGQHNVWIGKKMHPGHEDGRVYGTVAQRLERYRVEVAGSSPVQRFAVGSSRVRAQLRQRSSVRVRPVPRKIVW